MSARLPNFLIVGAPKCGTTSLADWLRAHPDVWIPPEKELAFFDRPDGGQDLTWYRTCFAPSRDEAAVGEATPTYMTSPDIVARLAEVLPDARLIAMLRNPVDRAYSHYQHWFAREGETRTFEQVVEHELQPGNAEVPGRWNPRHPERYSYLAHGNYTLQLDWLGEHYAPEALHVVVFDDLRTDPAGVFKAACRFLGVDDATVPEEVGTASNPFLYYHPAWLWSLFVRVRIGRWLPARAGAAIWRRFVREGQDYEPMDAALRARLLEHFAPERARLAARLGRDLSAWAA